MIETHRGIITNTTPKHEEKFKTIKNRWGQLSVSLPRIDDKKRWAGYPGNTGISKKLARLIPDCQTYVEPFAGTAKVFQEAFKLDPCPVEIFVLNDKSLTVSGWLRKHFHDDVSVIATRQDFVKCVKRWDADDTVFVFDQPWFESYYDQVFSCFDRYSTATYDKEVLDLCNSMKGKFFITTRIENPTMRNSKFKKLLIESEYVVAGKYPKVLVTTNVSGEDLK